jgi:hypothetical protein
LKQVKRPNAIQVARKGSSRLPGLEEARSLVLGALGTLSKLSGVRTANIEVNGKPVAVAVIEDVVFAEDANGNTILNAVAEELLEKTQ